MRLHWASLWESVGVGFGYSVHQKMLLQAVRRAGTEITPDADIAVHVSTCDAFRPVPGKKNVLYTMYESTTIPETWVEPLNRADLVVVPCKQNQLLFRQYTKLPVEVCWEGVDPLVFRAIDRPFPKDRPFVFLWSGATNPRKGTEYVMGAWSLWMHHHPELRAKSMLVMKTTQEEAKKAKMAVEVRASDNGEVLQRMVHEEEMPAERIVRVGPNAIVDTRRLPVKRDGEPGKRPESLVELYQMAHAFMLPSMGEGFGLTLAEAAATGLPCIYTPWGGPVDFMDRSVGYPVHFNFKPVAAVGFKPNGERYISHRSWAASPDPKDVFRKMEQIYYGYEDARARGRRAAERMKRSFTWDTSAASFLEIMARYADQWAIREAA